MQTIDMDKGELFSLIKRAVREVIQEEIGRAWVEGIATVTDEEQEDINRRHGKPDRPRKIESRETVDL
jgi:20S proteasome alpha/beta subunit